MSEKTEDVPSFDVAGCRGHCYGGYHMTEDRDGGGEWVMAKNYRALQASIADLERQFAESQAREAALREAIEAARAEEREACARICEVEASKWPYPSHANASATVAAATIRARGKR